ncbi:hypothetical protein RTP6_001670 [Batrachochytrium dendrobatidis]
MFNSSSVKKSLDLLVQRTTGFQLGTENLAISVEFAQTQLKNQVFTTTNANQILAKCKGLVEKYQLRGDDNKAETMAEAVQMLESRVKKQNSLNSVFDIVSLLLSLSKSATLYNYERLSKPRMHLTPDNNAAIWTEICNDAPLTGDHWSKETVDTDDSDNWSMNESEFLDTPIDEKIQDHACHLQATQSDSGIVSAAFSDYSKHNSIQSQLNQLDLRQEWQEHGETTDLLDTILDTQYWTSVGCRTLVQNVNYDSKDPCSLRPSIAHHESQSFAHLFRPLSSVKYVKEQEIVRECILLLAGLNTTMFAKDKQGKWKWTSKYSVTHLTDDSLANLIQNGVVSVANKIELLRVFATSILEQSFSSVWCVFASCILRHLEKWRKHLLVIEMGMLQPKLATETQTNSLIWLESHVAMHSIPVLCLAELIQHEAFSNPDLNCSKNSISTFTAKLLNLIYSRITIMQLQGNICQMHFLVELFIVTLSPLLDFLDNSMGQGKIDDLYNEFFFKMGEDIPKSNPDYWSKHIMLRSKDDVPIFMTQFISDIVHAIKISKLYTSKAGHCYDKAQQSIADILKLELTEFCKFTDVANPSECLKVKIDECFQNGQGHFEFKAPSIIDLNPKDSINSNWQPFETLIQTALAKALSASLHQSHVKFQDIVFLQSQFQSHLKILHGVFLLLMPDPMSFFCDQLFYKMESHWSGNNDLTRNPLVLQTLFLQVSLETNRDLHAYMDNFLWQWNDVAWMKQPNISKQSFFSKINVTYSCPWSIDLIVGNSGWILYNRIMSLIMYINYARFCLQRVQSWKQTCCGNTVSKSEPDRGVIRLRMKLLHFLISLQTYVMHGILQPESSVFLAMATKKTSVDELILLHSKFVRFLAERLFLTEKAWPILKEIYSILDMCIKIGGIIGTNDPLVFHSAGLNETPYQKSQPKKAEFNANSNLAKLVAMEFQLDDAIRFLVDSLNVMATHVDSSVSIETLALSLSFKNER